MASEQKGNSLIVCLVLCLACIFCAILVTTIHRHSSSHSKNSRGNSQETKPPLPALTYESCLQSTIVPDGSEAFEVATSPVSGRKFIAGVVTMRRTVESKLVAFEAEWRRSWPELNIAPFFGFQNHPSLRGMGNLAAMYRLCLSALQLKKPFDYLLIFEDDGVPYENTTWPYDLDLSLDSFDKADGSGLLLGGHHITGYNKDYLQKFILPSAPGSIRAKMAFGAYGMAIPRKFLKELACHYEVTLSKKSGESMSSDLDNWHLWNQLGGGGFVAAPLLVEHRSNAFSFTWNRFRGSDGVREFWNEK